MVAFRSVKERPFVERWAAYATHGPMMRHHSGILILCGVALGCSEGNQSKHLDYSKNTLNVEKILEQEFRKSPSITFRSYDGEYRGADCDTDIELQSTGNVLLTKYRASVSRYQGTYSIQDGRKLSLSFKNYNAGHWLLYLIRDDSALLLVPADNETWGSGVGGDWPFRQLPHKTVKK